MKLSMLQKMTLLCLIASRYTTAHGYIEHDLNVEQDKKHRHDIKLHAEAWLAFTLGDHAAFVRGILGWRTFSAFAYQHADNQRRGGEEDRYKDLQENRQIFA